MRRGAILSVLACVLFISPGCGSKICTLRVDVEGWGSVTPASGARYARGAVAHLTCTAAPGWVFDRWEGDKAAEVAGTRITMDGSKSLKAVFVQRKSDYAGIEVGREWTYATSTDSSRYTVEVVSKRTGPTGKTEFRFGPDSGWTVMADKRGYHIVGDWGGLTETRYRKSVTLLTKPIKVGSLGMQNCRAVRQESVTVPAGTYTAWRFEDTAGSITAWFTPRVGWVKIATAGGVDELVELR